MVNPEYKETEVGLVPEDWEAKPIQSFAHIAMCKRIFAEQTSEMGEIPFYKIGTFGKEADAYISRKLYLEYREKFSFPQKGDILISAAGTLGRTVKFDGKDSYFQDSNIVWLDIDKQQLCNDYLYQYYNVIKWASSEGSTISRLYNGIIYNTYIALPPLEEQQKIAEALSDMDGLIASLEKLIAKKKAVKQGAMQELLTGKKRLPGFDGAWVSCNITEVLCRDAGIKIGPFGSQLKKEYLVKNGPYKVYGQENVYEKDFSIGERYLEKDRFLQLQSCEIQKGDFLITTMGTIGKCIVIQQDIPRGIMDSHLIRLRVDSHKIIPEFLLYLFAPEFGFLEAQTQKLSVGGIMDGLSTKIVSSLYIQYPKEILEQQAIVTILSDMDAEIEALEQKLAKCRQVKQGMMQQLLTGKIRLV